jgi:hypothetical protein
MKQEGKRMAETLGGTDSAGMHRGSRMLSAPYVPELVSKTVDPPGQPAPCSCLQTTRYESLAVLMYACANRAIKAGACAGWLMVLRCILCQPAWRGHSSECCSQSKHGVPSMEVWIRT